MMMGQVKLSPKQLLICTSYITGWQQSSIFPDNKYISGARSAIVSMQYAWIHQGYAVILNHNHNSISKKVNKQVH